MTDRVWPAAAVSRLTNRGFRPVGEASIGGATCQVYRRSDFRWGWLATRLHTFVFVIDAGSAGLDEIREIATASRDFARKHKGGMPGGLQTGTAAFPIFAVEQVDHALARWASEPQPVKFSAGLFPVVIDYAGSRVSYRVSSQRWGRIYEEFLRRLAADLVGLAPGAPPAVTRDNTK